MSADRQVGGAAAWAFLAIVVCVIALCVCALLSTGCSSIGKRVLESGICGPGWTNAAPSTQYPVPSSSAPEAAP